MNLHCRASFEDDQTAIVFMRESSDPPYLVYAGTTVISTRLATKDVLISMCTTWYVDQKQSPNGAVCDIQIPEGMGFIDDEVLREADPRIYVCVPK
jgi:hypothetical protein